MSFWLNFVVVFFDCLHCFFFFEDRWQTPSDFQMNCCLAQQCQVFEWRDLMFASVKSSSCNAFSWCQMCNKSSWDANRSDVKSSFCYTIELLGHFNRRIFDFSYRLLSLFSRVHRNCLIIMWTSNRSIRNVPIGHNVQRCKLAIERLQCAKSKHISIIEPFISTMYSVFYGSFCFILFPTASKKWKQQIVLSSSM